MELGKRLNILREQFGREQAASLEETYKQSREEGELEETGERRAQDQSGKDYKAIKQKQSDTAKDDTEGENDFQAKKVGHVNISMINEVSPENEMDQDQTEQQKSETGIDSMSFTAKGKSEGENSLAVSRSTSKSNGENQREGNT